MTVGLSAMRILHDAIRLRRCIMIGIMRLPVTPALAGLLLGLTAFAVAQQPKLSPAEEGRSLFRLACGLCHGPEGGGGVRGPNLTSSVLQHGSTDEEIKHTIQSGVAGTAMPANDLSDDELNQLVAFLRARRAPSPEKRTGNAEAGRELFWGEGNCSSCHMVEGKGGRLGPNLSRVGSSRSLPYLRQSIRTPDADLSVGMQEPFKDFAQLYEKVIVTTADGTKVTGVALNEDAYSVQLMDLSQQLRLFLKSEVKQVQHTGRSLMPAYNEDVLDDAAVRDLVAYLYTLKGRP